MSSNNLHTPFPTHADHTADSEILDLVEYWRSIARRKKSILALGIVIALLAWVITMAMTPIYVATTTIMVESNKSNVVSVEDVYSGLGQNREFFQTQAEIVKSREVAIKTIRKLRLWENPEYDPRIQDKSAVNDFLQSSGIQGLLESIGFAEATPEPEWNETNLADAVYGKFSKDLLIEPVRLSQLIKISFESPDPKLSADVANAIATTYIENDLDARYKMTEKASTWLQERLSGLKANLSESEKRLQAFRERTGLVDIKSDSQSGYGQQVDAATKELITAKVRLAEFENAYKQISSAPEGADLSSIPAVVRNAAVAEALKQQSEAERKLSEISQRYGQEHPKFVQAQGDVKSAQENVKRQVNTVVASVTREYQTALGTVRAIQGTLNEAKGSVQSVGRKGYELNVLQREVDSNQQIYDLFLNRAKETSSTRDLQTPIARVVDSAVPPTKPAKPKKNLITLAAFAFGLFAGAVIALLLDHLDNTVKTTRDVEERLRQPLLARMPIVKRKEARSIGRSVLTHPQSLYSESVRTARTGVMLSAIDATNRIVVVTSSVPGEGKSTFSTNLALAMAQTKKTLLIDADMRRPSVAKSLALEPGVRGLSEYCAGSAKLEECMHKVKDSELTVLPTGAIPPNPLEVLLSDRFKSTLEALSREYEVIIVDSPPVGLVSDATVLASLATGVVYMVKAAETPLPLITKGLQQLRQANTSIFGVVLNSMNFEKADRYYGEYSGYKNYGYSSYGYTSKEA